MCNRVERRIFEQINQHLRLYLWERTRGKVTDSAGECLSVSATNKANEYCAKLSIRGFILYDLNTFVTWFSATGASNIRIMSMIYDSTANDCEVSFYGSVEIGQWLVYFEVQ